MGMVVKRFLFIRHGKTQSNIERRYIGDPAEPLCEAGIREVSTLAQRHTLPHIAKLVSGSALRCCQTAELLFPDRAYTVCSLAETDFGVFKGKNAEDLLGDKDYEQWLETGCMGDIPGGDSVATFKERCCETFAEMVETSGPGINALVIHGGNIMAILERYAKPGQDFYAYHVPNCGFFLCRYENGILSIEQKGGIA